MPQEFDLTDDQYVFRMRTRHGDVFVDSHQLMSATLEIVGTKAPSVAASEGSAIDPAENRLCTIEAVKATAWPQDIVTKLTDHELFSIGARVCQRLTELGNA